MPRTLERALGFRRGPVLAGLSERPFHTTAVGPIEDRLDRAVEDWAELVLRNGTDDDLSAVVAALQRLREAQPWRERSTELLMWALFRQARQRDALAAYEQTRRRLADDLGVDIWPALREMHARVLRQEDRCSRESPDDACGGRPASTRSSGARRTSMRCASS